MRIESGNLWTYPAQYVAVTTNGVVNDSGELVMGAGVALHAKRLYPELPKILGKYVNKYGNRVFLLKEQKIITFPTKHHWKDKSDLFLIRKSAREATEIADKFKIVSVACPKFGCGNGGLDWKEVKCWIDTILDDRFIIITPWVSEALAA